MIIENEILGIIAIGENKEGAKKDFCEEFDHIYKSLNGLPREKLSKDALLMKDNINFISLTNG